MRWFKFYPHDYLKGVRGLTPEEAGIYMAVLALMYEEGGAIPNDEKWITGAARCSVRAWRRVLERLCRLGKIVVDIDGHLVNHRVINEISLAHEAEIKRRSSAVQAGIASGKSRAKANENNEEPERTVERQLNHIEDKKKNKRNTPSTRVSGKAAANPLIPFPENWVPSDAMRTFATKIGFTPTEFDAAAQDFREYWAEKPLERRTAGGWSITFQKNLKTIATSEGLRAQLRLVTVDGALPGQPSDEQRADILDKMFRRGKYADAQ